MTVGVRIKEARERRGWSQSELARQMQDSGWPKYSQVSVARTESGERDLRVSEAVALAKVLSLSLEGLVSGDSPDLYAEGYLDGIRAARNAIEVLG